MPLSGWEPGRTGPLRQLELCACVAARGRGRGRAWGTPASSGVFVPGPAYPVPGQLPRARTGGNWAAAAARPAKARARGKTRGGVSPGILSFWGERRSAGGCASTSFEEAAGRSAGPARGGLFEDPASALSPGTGRRDLASSARALDSPKRGAGGGTPG